MRRLAQLVSTLLLISLTTVAVAQNYFPLDTGLVWTYTNVAGNNLEGTVLGPVEYDGLTVVEIQYLESGGGTQEFHNFWTKEAGGVVWLHGAWNVDGFSATYEVFEEGDTTIPMGTFYAYGIGPSEPPLPAGELKGHDIMGRRLDSDSREANRWYTENIGTVRGMGGYELVSFSGTVATEQTTWSGVKALFIQ